MNFFFDSCTDAIDCAVNTKSFGLYYSTKTTPNLLVHVHDCCEVFLSLSDGNSFLIDDKIYSVNKNDLFIINQFEAHKVSPAKKQFERFSLHVHPTFLHANSTEEINLTECFYGENKIDRLSLSEIETDELKKLFNELSNDFGFGDQVVKKLRATELLIAVLRLYKIHSVGTVTNDGNNALQLAIDYINQNYAQQISLKDVAKNAFISVNQLCALFKRYCSTTVIKYLTGKRISEAKKMLCNHKSVTETAFACGFNDYANFIRVFKKTVGVPPGKYKINTATDK